MRHLHFVVFLVSIALIAFEVSLMQVLSLVQWHHFAAMIISIALLGFGASGTIISLHRRWMLDHFDILIPPLAAGCAISMATAVPLTQSQPASFDSLLVFIDSANAAALLVTYLILFVPFCLGALTIGLTFVKHADDIGRLYFWNLLGSGLGAVIVVLLMWAVHPATLPACSALAAATAAMVASSRKRSKTVRVAAAVSIVVGSYFALSPQDLRLSQYKDISRALDLPDASIVRERVSSHGFVQIVETPVARHAPGLSFHFRGELGVRDLAFVNGDATGATSNWTEDDSTHILDYTTRALPFELRSPRRALVLGSATGESVAQALSRGADRVVAVEPNAALSDVIRIDSTSVLNSSLVTVRSVDPRSALRHGTAEFGLIILPDAGRFGGTIGLRETEEDYLLTVEALDEMWARLDASGSIAITAWMDYPYRNPVKVATLLANALRERNLDPVRHLAAVRSWTDITYLLVKTPLTVQDGTRVRAFCDRMGFDPLLLPDIAEAERNEMNALQDSSLFGSLDDVVGPGWMDLVNGFDFDIAPPTDDRPYFSRFLRWSSLAGILDQFGSQTTPFFGLGLFIAFLTLLQAIVTSFVLIVAPLFRIQVRRARLLPTLGYFASIGIGFMFIEIVLIQRFTLFLGQPVYAVSTILGVVLVGSGCGAYLSSRQDATRTVVSRSALIVAVLTIVYIGMLDPLFRATIGFPLVGRALLTAILLLPVAVRMGYLFPIGLRLVSKRAADQVPWAWGVNGCLSVVAAAAAPLISIEWGFTVLMVLAAGAYAIAALVGRTV